jgi:uncharacterized membrane protein
MSAKPFAHAAMLALLTLIVAWHAWLAPPQHLSPALAIGAHAALLLPGLVLLALRDRRAAFFGALAALVLFCHGVMEAWSAPAVRGLALAETALSVVAIVGASLDGLRARFARRRGV